MLLTESSVFVLILIPDHRVVHLGDALIDTLCLELFGFTFNISFTQEDVLFFFLFGCLSLTFRDHTDDNREPLLCMTIQGWEIKLGC